MAEQTPMLVSLQMPFYPIRSAYEKRRLFDMQHPMLLENYIEALRREIEAAAPDYADCEIQAMRLSGGIAGHAADEPLGVLLRDMRSLFHFSSDAPVILNVHPGMVSVDTLTACHRGRVTALSVDYCTSDPFESEAVGRFLPPNAMDTTMLVLGNEKIDLSFHIITGLPGQSMASLERTLQQVKAYGAKEIVPHPLEIVPGTQLAAEAAAMSASASPRKHLPSEKERTDLFRFAQAWCENEGYHETIPGRFSRSDYTSRYHQMQMEGMALLGFGAGAQTRMDGVEAENTWDLDQYICHSPDPEKIIARVAPAGETATSR